MDRLRLNRMSSYERKNARSGESRQAERLRPEIVGFSVYLWNHLAIREIVSITRLLFPSIAFVLEGPELAALPAREPDSGGSIRIEEDGTVSSPLPPRAILKNNTFSLADMITARLIGHGTDLFNSFPRVASRSLQS